MRLDRYRNLSQFPLQLLSDYVIHHFTRFAFPFNRHFQQPISSSSNIRPSSLRFHPLHSSRKPFRIRKMPPKKRSAEVEEYDSDGGFVEDAPKSKKSKMSKIGASGSSKAAGGASTGKYGEVFWEVCAQRSCSRCKG